MAAAVATTSDPTTEMSESLKARIENHPCYSEEAHHHYARMQVAVASRLQHSMQLLQPQIRLRQRKPPRRGERTATPEEAAHKVMVVAGKIPQMTVLGIAGPGDPLANPEKTFRTFELVAEQAPRH